MRTTTVARTSYDTLYPDLDLKIREIAFRDQRVRASTILEAFKAAHGITTDNLVEQTEDHPRLTIRSWPSVEIAQAWVDCVLRGDFTEGLEYPPVILSAQVNPE
jgi:hypothetical protein